MGSGAAAPLRTTGTLQGEGRPQRSPRRLGTRKESEGRCKLAPTRPLLYLETTMSDLQDRLQAALGESYRIERELGGGGMSRVFLAVETALGRHVVVKVLPPEMAAGVNIERFRREIQLAASLQHPHIVPLHAAGQSGDIFYYTMPLVEGESLRAKLAREGELPVGEVIRVLRDVVDALAYAHAHGVVHRDIKPDNILLSGNHALVTDFGVAKAVSAASGSSSLTSLGVALGTPAYMAPEQAAADPHVDHRADLYAVGAVAYEMLCGRPPFTGMSPQQVLAAHVTLAPEPPTAHRPSVPPGLNAMVMRCLEKKPADRVQRAEELLTQLEAMATPSGGMAPTGATAAISSGTEAAIRRAHPVRVAVLFGIASLVMLALVYWLMIRLGLPDWVFAGAVALLVIGLPIMLVTGRAERARAIARTTGTFPVQVGAQRWFTWRRALAGGALAFAALAVTVGAYTAMRLLGIGPVGTLMASGVLKERQPIILADFDNRTADSTLGPTLTEAFRVDLSQSPTVKLTDVASVSEALQRMQRPPNTPLTPAVAREVAQREGVKAIVAGEIAPVGKGFILSANVLSASDGRSLAAVRETAANDAALIPALDRLSKALRERIGESLVTIRADEPLAQVTTSSLDALRRYTEAIKLADVGRDEAAVYPLKEATQLDSGFAMAWRKLAVVLGNTEASYQAQMDATTRAYQNRDRLPEIEKQQTISYYYQIVEWDPAKAAQAYRAILARDPNNDIALNNLGQLLFTTHQFSEAESLLVRGVALNGGVVFYENVARAQVFQGHFGDARRTLTQLDKISPNNPEVAQMFSLLASTQFQYDSAEKYLAQARELSKSSRAARADVARISYDLALTQGELSKAEQGAREFMTVSEERQNLGAYLMGGAWLAHIDAKFRSRPPAALATLDAALTHHPLASLNPGDRPYGPLAQFNAENGRVAEAKRLLAEQDGLFPAAVVRGDLTRYPARGAIAVAEGRSADAIKIYHAWHDSTPCAPCGLFELGAVFQHDGQADSARAYYEAYVGAHGLGRIYYDENLAAAYQRLGELYEAKGDRARAVDFYTKMVNQYKNADPDLQPIVRDVRGRIARLAADQ